MSGDMPKVTVTQWAVCVRLKDGTLSVAAPGCRAALFLDFLHGEAFAKDFAERQNQALPAWPPMWEARRVRVTIEPIEEDQPPHAAD